MVGWLLEIQAGLVGILSPVSRVLSAVPKSPRGLAAVVSRADLGLPSGMDPVCAPGSPQVPGHSCVDSRRSCSCPRKGPLSQGAGLCDVPPGCPVGPEQVFFSTCQRPFLPSLWETGGETRLLLSGRIKGSWNCREGLDWMWVGWNRGATSCFAGGWVLGRRRGWAGNNGS